MEDQHRVDDERITIKGIRQGLLVTLGQGPWGQLLQALDARLGESPAFFRGGRVALDVRDRELVHEQIEEARSVAARQQVEMWALLSTNAATQAIARESGLVIDLGTASGPEHERDKEKDPSGEAIVVRRTLRSGQTVRRPGHIVIIGDVNPGAEVVAGGDIVVWGRARGLVHAGALGSKDAVICALDLAPTQLRIGSCIARSPEERRDRPVPEKASVRDGQIVAVPWPGE
ncbi:MAG: septum site-determining protein MinC [Anaerolineae bacterium]|jgi:septum site-determining protein MinC